MTDRNPYHPYGLSPTPESYTRTDEPVDPDIDELQRINRRLNQQIENQARNAEEDQRAIEAIGAERDEYRAMHSQQMKTIARLQENPRPLTADDRSRAYEAFHEVWGRPGSLTREAVNAALDAALTPPPTRPEGAEEIEGDLIDIIGAGVLNDSEFDTISIKLAERGYRKTGGN